MIKPLLNQILDLFFLLLFLPREIISATKRGQKRAITLLILPHLSVNFTCDMEIDGRCLFYSFTTYHICWVNSRGGSIKLFHVRYGNLQYLPIPISISYLVLWAAVAEATVSMFTACLAKLS